MTHDVANSSPQRRPGRLRVLIADDHPMYWVTTVKTHLHHIYEKLEVSDRAAAVAQALRRGLLK